MEYGYLGNTFCAWTEKYGGTVMHNSLFETRYFTEDPHVIKAILATQFPKFGKGPKAQTFLKVLLGSGIFNSDGEMWKFHRNIARPFFNKDRITHFDDFERHAQALFNQAQERLDEGLPIDFQDLISQFTLDSATEYLFGHDVKSLTAGLPYPSSHPLHGTHDDHPANMFATAFVNAQGLSALRSRRGDHWALAEFWEDRVKVHRQAVDQFIDPILAVALARKKAGKDDASNSQNSELSDTMLEHLLESTEDQEIIRDSILNMLVAGRDTTACTLTFIIMSLAQHPEALRKLREEILSIIGPERRPTFDDMRDLKYLRAVINETLRLYPPVPFNARTAFDEPVIVPSDKEGQPPLYIPAGTKCVYSVCLMHRRKDLWGPDALEYDPNRWLDDRSKRYFTPNPFIFTPFNAGPRICLGQQFAYHEISYFLVRLLQQYGGFKLRPDCQDEIEKPPSQWKGLPGPKGRDDIWPKSGLTLYSRGGLWLTMEKASPN